MYQYKKLIWEDDFNSSVLDTTKWNYRTGNWQVNSSGAPVVSGWGNRELQYYTTSPNNLRLNDSCLQIIARKETSPEQFGQKYPYTSARIDSFGKFSFTFGRIEFRACCPLGAGLWPAVWMLPLDNAYGPWAASGEIDLLETKGRLRDKIYGTIHYGGACPNNLHREHSFSLPLGTGIDSFHIYECVWEPGKISWIVDGILYAQISEWGLPGDTKPFDRPFYLLINLAVGGTFDLPSEKKITDVFPSKFLVDYIRVFQ